MGSSEQSVSALLVQLWHQFLPQLEERVAVLDEAASSLSSQNLSEDLRARAQEAAHKLAGSLGTFGLAVGTDIAREAELMLAADPRALATSGRRLGELSAQLHKLLTGHDPGRGSDYTQER